MALPEGVADAAECTSHDFNVKELAGLRPTTLPCLSHHAGSLVMAFMKRAPVAPITVPVTCQPAAKSARGTNRRSAGPVQYTWAKRDQGQPG
jgi:hypothetical protein